MLTERTGLLETTVRSLLAGHGELMSWEVVSACLAAADDEAAGRMRGRWAAVERAMWDERGDGPRAAFEKDPRGRPAKIVEMFQPKVPWRRLTARHPVTFEPWAEPAFEAVRSLPDPASAGDLREFYGLLARLRTWAGSPPQTELERRSWGALPDATVSAMLQKDRWRTPSDRERRRIGYFAAACGLPEPEVARWVEGYDRLRYLPPPDDPVRARAEAAEAAEQLAEARAESDRLKKAQAETLERLAEARAEAAELRERLTAVRAEAAELRGRLAADEEARPGRWRHPYVRRTASAVIGAALFASGALAGVVVDNPPGGSCFEGTLRLVGSTAFEHMARTVASGYEELCPDATVEVEAIGSNEGARLLADPGTDAATTIAMHDGHLRADSAEVRLRGFQGLAVSLVSFAVVVNKDTDVAGLSAADLRSVYAEDAGPVNWRRLGGADLPIRLIGRNEGSGTRTIFEERVLTGPEPRLSSRDCLTRDELYAGSRLIRCERSSQSQVLDLVGRTPGAIGYSELQEAADTRRHPNLRVLALDGRKPDASAEPGGYPFIAPEVLYTRGVPANGTPASAFLTFLTTGTARSLLERLGAPPCVGPTEPMAALCGPA
ncbi:substrate-binding domain-containing protein [Actinocorallia sp. B10E7]|uniref:substrate-binding domain-containing protein n=1 Tax=Actinocorallia sp. B10E7 TaxID=3153558 RepID=UPI00325CD976